MKRAAANARPVRYTRIAARILRSVSLHAAVLLVALLILAPFAWLFISSISPMSDLIARPLRWIPPHANLTRYVKLFVGADGEVFRMALRNSAIVAGLATVISLLVGMFGAYSLSRFRSTRRSGLLYVMLATYMTPPVAILLPVYLLLSQLGLLNTTTGLALVYCSFLTPFLTWILKGFFDSIPFELEEAAMIDGVSRVGTLGRIVLPLALPGVVTAVLFGVLLAWDEFLYALTFTSTTVAKTLPIAISEFTARHAVDYGLIATGGIIASLPPVVLALALQKYLVAGLTAGGVKG